jgi:hypothetical protein
MVAIRNQWHSSYRARQHQDPGRRSRAGSLAAWRASVSMLSIELPVSNRFRLRRLGRPRIDVVMTVSGIFRDLFSPTVQLLDKAVRLVAWMSRLN